MAVRVREVPFQERRRLLPVFDLRNALRRNNTEFGQMPPQRINQLRALPDQHIARAVRHGLGLLRLGFHCNKPHCRT